MNGVQCGCFVTLLSIVHLLSSLRSGRGMLTLPDVPTAGERMCVCVCVCVCVCTLCVCTCVVRVCANVCTCLSVCLHEFMHMCWYVHLVVASFLAET